jgi:hypothetical protein
MNGTLLAKERIEYFSVSVLYPCRALPLADVIVALEISSLISYDGSEFEATYPYPLRSV